MGRGVVTNTRLATLTFKKNAIKNNLKGRNNHLQYHINSPLKRKSEHSPSELASLKPKLQLCGRQGRHPRWPEILRFAVSGGCKWSRPLSQLTSEHRLTWTKLESCLLALAGLWVGTGFMAVQSATR